MFHQYVNANSHGYIYSNFYEYGAPLCGPKARTGAPLKTATEFCLVE